MKKEININTEQKQKLKKYAVFALMLIIFAGSMWWIFAPSEADKAKEKQQQGFNADIPDPDGGDLIANKKDAYEHEQMQEKQKERMKSLEGYIGMLEGEKSGEQVSIAMIDDEAPPMPIESPKQKEPITSSVVAYQDINRTLGNFYEQPREDLEKEDMKKRLEELEAKITDKDNRQSEMDEQLALMEKSYELAAKYIPKGDNQSGVGSSGLENPAKTNTSEGKNGKTNVSPIRRIQNQTVSSLAQNFSNEELFYMFAQERNVGFNTMSSEMGVSTKNTISAVIHDDQTVIDGQTTRFRLTEPLMAGTTMIPSNTILTGMAKIQGERLDIQISSIEHQGMIVPVEMNIYDTDGQRGIYIPGSLELNAAKEIMANMGNSVGSSFTMTQSAGAQLSSDLSKGAIQGMSAYMQKKIRQTKVHLKSGYRVMLMPKAN